MATEAIEPAGTGPRPTYLQALAATRVPADRIMVQAETLGYAPEELLRLAEDLAEPGRGNSMAALALVLGSVEHWQPLADRALALGIRLFEPLLRPCCSELDPLVRLLEDGDRERLYRRILERLGHPLPPGSRAAGAMAATSVLPWLERGLGLVLDQLELARFTSRSAVWGPLRVDSLVLRDGAGPRTLELAPGEPSAGDRSLRLHRVGTLRALEGLEHLAILVAGACPDLERLNATPPVTVLKGCPRVRELRAHPRSRLLHLEDCRALRSIGAERVWDGATKVTPSYRNVILAHCPALRYLPARMDVTGTLLLRGLGPIDIWPMDLRIGGDLVLGDCPAIEALPTLEVLGSLRVRGASGLRRLAPGSVIGGDLDLRACRQLHAIPWGVKVGGSLYLPAHLKGEREPGAGLGSQAASLRAFREALGVSQAAGWSWPGPGAGG